MAPAPNHEEGSEAPSMLDLVRLSPRRLYPPGGVDLVRQIALLSDMSEGDEVLVVGCGKGVSLEYFVREYGVRGSGVEHDARLVEETTDRFRALDLGTRAQIQQGVADALPYRDAIFDVVVGEIGTTTRADPARAVEQIARVTRPGGTIVLVQPIWKAPVDPVRRSILSEHLGVSPQMLVEWKRLLRTNGVGEILVEDWSDDETAFRGSAAKPFPDFAELFTLPEKLGILRRAWRRWGWTGVKAVIQRERDVHRLLTRERLLGLDLIKGVRADALDDPVPALTADAEDVAPELSLFDES
jgi:SAM-dependent methyltransferase